MLKPLSFYVVVYNQRCAQRAVMIRIVRWHHCMLYKFVRNLMAHSQKPDFVFPRNGRVHSNRWGRQFSRLLAAEVCASAWVMLDIPCSEVAWEYWLPTPLASFPFTSPSRASPCATRFRTSSTVPSQMLIITTMWDVLPYIAWPHDLFNGFILKKKGNIIFIIGKSLA